MIRRKQNSVSQRDSGSIPTFKAGQYQSSRKPGNARYNRLADTRNFSEPLAIDLRTFLL